MLCLLLFDYCKFFNRINLLEILKSWGVLAPDLISHLQLFFLQIPTYFSKTKFLGVVWFKSLIALSACLSLFLSSSVQFFASAFFFKSFFNFIASSRVLDVCFLNLDLFVVSIFSNNSGFSIKKSLITMLA